ncbi:Uncharacterised protein [Vibrio cholerae]|nr:Uncharacterised protein [Vibrio cholerae]
MSSIDLGNLGTTSARRYGLTPELLGWRGLGLFRLCLSSARCYLTRFRFALVPVNLRWKLLYSRDDQRICRVCHLLHVHSAQRKCIHSPHLLGCRPCRLTTLTMFGRWLGRC